MGAPRRHQGVYAAFTPVAGSGSDSIARSHRDGFRARIGRYAPIRMRETHRAALLCWSKKGRRHRQRPGTEKIAREEMSNHSNLPPAAPARTHWRIEFILPARQRDEFCWFA
jgi:hypothetical protein